MRLDTVPLPVEEVARAAPEYERQIAMQRREIRPRGNPCDDRQAVGAADLQMEHEFRTEVFLAE